MFILKIFKPKSQSRHQNDNGKTLGKAIHRQKTDHKSKFGGTSAQSFQAYGRAVPISCHEQKAQTQGWPSLTFVLVDHDNRSGKLDCRSGKVGAEVLSNLDEWSASYPA